MLTRFNERARRGWGIGLTLVRQIVDRYEGKIWIEDRVPKDHTEGASFVLVLPTAS
ncbi:MAG: ATP-binding protein [Candidatus Thorarchaeota archaeon]